METRSTKGFRQRVLRHLWKSLIFIISALLHRKVILKRCNKWLSQHFSSHLPPTDSSNGYIILKTITSLVRFPWQHPRHQKTRKITWNGPPRHCKKISSYCWYLKSCTTKDDDYPIVNRVLTIPGGCLGYLPSTVATRFRKFTNESYPRWTSWNHAMHTLPGTWILWSQLFILAPVWCCFIFGMWEPSLKLRGLVTS